jgi:transposase
MQGCKQFEPRLFYQISLEQYVPADHLVRRLAAVLDFSWVRPATAAYYSHTGKPSIDPVVTAKLLLLGYFYNIGSERQLMRDVQVNLAYRWYLGYDLDEAIPNHSVLSKARRRLGEEFFGQLFAYVLQCCRDAGLVKGDNLFLDSTLVEANASLDSITSLRYRPAEYWRQLEQAEAMQAEELNDGDAGDPADGMGQKRPRQNRTCDRKYSSTDPEASLTRRPGQKAKPAYKTHFAADEANGVVTAVATTSAAVDDTAVVPQLLEQHEQQCRRPDRAIGDHLYGSQDCLGYLQEQGVETVMPPRQGGNKHGGFEKRQFVYNPSQDVYRCPAGQILRRRRTWKKAGKASYAGDPVVCGTCSLKKQCFSAQSVSGVRQITRFDTPYVDRAQAACASRQGRFLLRKRQTCIEGLFGQAKNFHGLRRARWRGLTKMHIQSLLTAVVLNVKKLLKSMGRKSAVYQRVRVPSDVLIYKKLYSLLFLIFVFFCNKNRNVFEIQIP